MGWPRRARWPCRWCDVTFGGDAWALLPEYMRQADEREGSPLLTWLSGVCDLVQATADWLGEDARTLDPATVPAGLLPFAAALGGFDVEWVPAAEQRTMVGSATARARGTVAAIAQRVGATLTGAKQVLITTPYGADPMAILVQVFTAELGGGGVPASEAAARAECPAWLALTFDDLAGMTYDQLGTAYATYDVMAATGKDYETLSQETP